MSAGPQDLFALAAELLAADIVALDNIPATQPGLEGAPERSFVSPGQPAIDCCPQLTVHVESVTDADTTPGGLMAGRRNVTGKKNHVRLVTTIVRCVQYTRGGGGIADIPQPAYLEATAEQMDADGWALWNHLYNAWRSGDLFSLCGEVFFEGLRSMTEAGTCVGWVLTIRVSLDGYDNAESS